MTIVKEVNYFTSSAFAVQTKDKFKGSFGSCTEAKNRFSRRHKVNCSILHTQNPFSLYLSQFHECRNSFFNGNKRAKRRKSHVFINELCLKVLGKFAPAVH